MVFAVIFIFRPYIYLYQFGSTTNLKENILFTTFLYCARLSLYMCVKEINSSTYKRRLLQEVFIYEYKYIIHIYYYAHVCAAQL